MTPTFKDAISNNVAKLIAGGLISLLSMIFTWAFTPVREIIAVPRTLIQIQGDFENRQQTMLKALDNQRKADSIIFCQIKELQIANKDNYRQLGIIKSKVNAIGSQFPMLHQRFSDIEQAVANTDFAWSIPFNNKSTDE
jgi:hypothetical protein